MSLKVLIIEDDPGLGQVVVAALAGAGFEPTLWSDGRALTAAEAASFSVLVLDLMLPSAYGMDILRELRAISDLPVLVLSGRSESTIVVGALALGADDYVLKPFVAEELVQRVAARARRPHVARTQLVEFGSFAVDLERRLVTSRGQEVQLTRVEFELLAVLANRPDEPVTRERLASRLLEPSNDASNARTVDVHVSRLRKKLGEPSAIETVWGIGYRLRRTAGAPR